MTVVDNRRATRVPVKLTVVLRDESFDGSMQFYSRDLSENGVFLASDLLLHEGVVVQLKIMLPENRVIKAAGMIVRVEDSTDPGISSGLGIEFLEISSEDTENLRGFLDELL